MDAQDPNFLARPPLSGEGARKGGLPAGSGPGLPETAAGPPKTATEAGGPDREGDRRRGLGLPKTATEAGGPDREVSGERATSALAEAVERVGDRWSLLIVHALLDGPARFNDLQTRVSGVSPNVLSQRLRRLEAEGVVIAIPYSQRPPRFAYELTARGRELAGALRLLAHWGARHLPPDDALRHEACGTPVEARWWCPTCNLPADQETTDLHHL